MMAYAEFGAGRMRELECESCRAKIIYPRIEPGKKYCLCWDWSQEERSMQRSMQIFIDRLRITWSGKQMQYSPPEGIARSLFFQNNSSKQKSFHLSARGLHDECSIHIHLCRNHLPWAFTTGILKKTQHWGIFPRLCSYNQMHCDSKPWWLFGRWLLCSILQVEVYHPLITSHILFVKDFKNLRRKWPRKVSFAK